MSIIQDKIGISNLVVYDKSSLDSFFGCGIIKYICENITDAAVECIDINTLVVDDSLKEHYSSIMFVSSIIKDEKILSKLSELFNENLIFFLCDKNIYNFVKKHTSKAYIQFDPNESCCMTIYKIGFGEFENVIPKEIKVIASRINNKYGSYNDYVSYECGFYKEDYDFDRLYTEIIDPICEDYTNSKCNEIISAGEEILLNDKTSILRNLTYIDSFIFKVDKIRKTAVVFTSGPISSKVFFDEEGLINPIFDSFNTIVSFNKCALGWEMSMFKLTGTEDELKEESETLLNEYKERIIELKELLYKYEIRVNSSKNKEEIELINSYKNEINEKSSLIAKEMTKIEKYKKLISFNCGKYLKNYDGFGDELFGKAIISDNKFLEIMKSKTI